MHGHLTSSSRQSGQASNAAGLELLATCPGLLHLALVSEKNRGRTVTIEVCPVKLGGRKQRPRKNEGYFKMDRTSSYVYSGSLYARQTYGGPPKRILIFQVPSHRCYISGIGRELNSFWTVLRSHVVMYLRIHASSSKTKRTLWHGFFNASVSGRNPAPLGNHG